MLSLFPSRAAGKRDWKEAPVGFNLERWRSWDLSPGRLHRISTGSRETGPTGQSSSQHRDQPFPCSRGLLPGNTGVSMQREAARGRDPSLPRPHQCCPSTGPSRCSALACRCTHGHTSSSTSSPRMHTRSLGENPTQRGHRCHGEETQGSGDTGRYGSSLKTFSFLLSFSL